MYTLTAYQVLDEWMIRLTYRPTAEEAAGGATTTTELATVAAKAGRDRDVDALGAISWALDQWFRWAAESAE
jgi:hypothetical protein